MPEERRLTFAQNLHVNVHSSFLSISLKLATLRMPFNRMAVKLPAVRPRHVTDHGRHRQQTFDTATHLNLQRITCDPAHRRFPGDKIFKMTKWHQRRRNEWLPGTGEAGVEGRGACVTNGRRGSLCGDSNGPVFTVTEVRTLATCEDQEHGGKWHGQGLQQCHCSACGLGL